MRVIHVLRKPLSESSVATNVLEHGCGALHVSDCRIPLHDGEESGRWPSNLILDSDVATDLDAWSPKTKSRPGFIKPHSHGGVTSVMKNDHAGHVMTYDDEGGPSRFFFRVGK